MHAKTRINRRIDMSFYNELISKIEAHVQLLFQDKQQGLCYHGLEHTLMVVQAASQMAEHYNLSEQDRFVVLAAAYFHDVGYLDGGSKQHEERGAKLATDYLLASGVGADICAKVSSCILATQIPQRPAGLLESILCDADLFHLGSEDFKDRSKLMLRELCHSKNSNISGGAWRKMTILLLQQHEYHTDYAKEKLSSKKQQNLQELLLEDQKVKADKALKKAKEKKGDRMSLPKKPERGIETMFRITSANNQRLSDMADNKSHILLTVNSIILSLVVTVLLHRLDKNSHLLIPTILLMLSVVLTMIFAILATIPKIPNGYFNGDNVDKKKVNLLFFGNFYKMNFEDYQQGMNKTMASSEILYSMLTKDVYSQGVSLGRKYVLLRYAYGIFMIGLILSVIAFSIAVALVS